MPTADRRDQFLEFCEVEALIDVDGTQLAGFAR
jgi:hypothetical protein